MDSSSGLTFVTLGPEEVRKRKTSRSLVRSHAMSKVWEERKEKQMRNQKNVVPDGGDETKEVLPARHVRTSARRLPTTRKSSLESGRVQDYGFNITPGTRSPSHEWTEEDFSQALVHYDLFSGMSRFCLCGECQHTAEQRPDLSSHSSASNSPQIRAGESLDFLGLDLIDPFKTTALFLDQRYCHFIQHYFDNLSWKLTVPKATWLSYAITDPALLHASIFHFAAQYHHSTSQRMGNDCFNHLGAAIRMVRERLQDPEQATSLTTIGTIARLVTAYAVYGPHETWLQHTHGMEKTVRLRGGLEGIGFGKHLQHALISNALAGAAVRGYVIPPTFRQTGDVSVAPSAKIFPNAARATSHAYGTAFSSLVGPHGLSQDMVDVFRYLGEMTYLLETVRVWAEDEQYRYSEAANNVLQKCIDLEQTESEWNETGVSSWTYHVRETTRLVALLYLYVVIREVPAEGLSYKIGLRQARSHLSKTDLANAWHPEQQSHLLLWILCVSACTAVEEDERTWYGTWLHHVTTQLCLGTWNETKGVLTGFIWTDGILDPKLIPLWEEFCGERAPESQAQSQPPHPTCSMGAQFPLPP